VYQIVTCHQPQDVSGALRSTLAVNSDPLQLGRGQPSPQVQVRCAQRAQLIQSDREGYLVVLELPSPSVLIVSLERRTVFGNNHPKAVAGYQIAVRQVLKNLDY